METITFRFKVFRSSCIYTVRLSVEGAKKVIAELATFSYIEQIWVLNAGIWQEQISNA